MSTVRVRLFAAARSAAGVAEIDCSAGTLSDVLVELNERFPGLAPVLPQCSFLVDEVSCNNPQTSISSGSFLDVLPPFAGG